MTRYQIRMTHANPEQLQRVELPGGRVVFERIAGHPTRPARAVDYNTWWEDIDTRQAVAAIGEGHQVRLG